MKTHVYDIRGWNLVTASKDAIVLRPGQSVFLKRLGATAFAAVIILGILWIYSSSFDFIRIGHFRVNMQSLLLFLMGLLAATGIIIPASSLWNQLRIERTARSDISVFYMGIVLPSWKEWPAQSFRHIIPGIKEVLRSSRYEKHFVWWFSVNLMPAMPDGTMIEFRLIEETRSGQVYFPKVIRQLGPALEQLTGIQAQGFEDAKIPVSGGRHERVQITSHSPRTQKRVFTSLEDVPPELRARFEQLKTEADRRGGSGMVSNVSENITITQNGETRTYHSVDEMPPELRARYEQVKRMAKGGPVPPGVSIRTEENIFETYDE